MPRVPAWRREAEVCIGREVGAADALWVDDWNADLTRTAPAPVPLVLSAIGCALPPAERERVVRAVAEARPPGGVVIVVDHNRPRRLGAALGALVRSPRAPGWSPAARWRRLAYPTARELQDAGLHVERLRLVAGERVQVVVAMRP